MTDCIDVDTFEIKSADLINQFEDSIKSNNTELYVSAMESQLYAELNILSHLHPESTIRSKAKELLQTLENKQMECKKFKFNFDKLIENETNQNKIESLNKYKRDMNEELNIDILTEINKLEREFIDNMVKSSQKTLQLTKEECGEDKTISATLPDVIPILFNCDNRETRKKVYFFYKNKDVEENKEILTKVINLRRKLYPNKTFFDGKLCSSFMTNTQLTSILDEAFADNKVNILKSMELLTSYAKNKFNIDKIEPWDINYVKQKYNLENVKQKESISIKLNKMMSSVVAFYEDFTKYTIKNADLSDSYKWCEDLSAYDVFENNEYLGRIYLDMFNREGKPMNICCLYGYHRSTNGYNNTAVVSMQFKSDDINVSEISKIMHEFGHAIHYISNKNEYRNLNSFNRAWDFVEIPSHFFESFYTDTKLLENIELTHEQIEQIQTNNSDMNIIDSAKIIALTDFDKKVHSITSEVTSDDICNMWYESFETHTLLDYSQNGKLLDLTSFGHIFTDYQGKYYSYMIGDAFSKRFHKMNTNDEEFRKKFTKNVLQNNNCVF